MWPRRHDRHRCGFADVSALTRNFAAVWPLLTLSWLMSAMNRLCFLYRSSFKGSCQYCACTRLRATSTTSHQVKQEAVSEGGRREERPPTVSERSPCRLHCSELYELNYTPSSSHRDTWAARKHLSGDKHTGYTQVMREGPRDDGT